MHKTIIVYIAPSVHMTLYIICCWMHELPQLKNTAVEIMWKSYLQSLLWLFHTCKLLLHDSSHCVNTTWISLVLWLNNYSVTPAHHHHLSLNFWIHWRTCSSGLYFRKFFRKLIITNLGCFNFAIPGCSTIKQIPILNVGCEPMHCNLGINLTKYSGKSFWVNV